jgi:hypothetical protein
MNRSLRPMVSNAPVMFITTENRAVVSSGPNSFDVSSTIE